LNLPEKSRPAKTKRFLIHSCGRPALIAARSGERRGVTGSAASACPAEAGTIGCSEVIVSILVGRGEKVPLKPEKCVATGYRCPTSALLMPVALGSFQRLQVVSVSGALAGPLHSKQVLERTDAHREAFDLDLRRLGIEYGEGGHLR
jgi:hypothetical protein